MDLNYCDDDAISFYNLLTSSGVKDQNIALLTDSKATKHNILHSLKRVFEKATVKDEVIFFFSGHGGDGCFVPYDYDGYSYLLGHSDIKAAFKQCKATRKLVLENEEYYA